jgi:N4-gp56 family major capsid protein
MVQTQVIDPVLEEAVSLLGEQCGQTVDVLCREVLNAGTNVRYAGGVANMGALTTSHKLTAAEARKAKLQLEVAKVPSFGGYYHAFIHPNAAEDLKDDPRWISAQGTMDPEALRTGLLGELDGVKYYKSPNCKVYDGAGQNGIDVYSTLFFGRGAYGVVSYEAPEIGGIDPAMAGGEQQFALPVQIIVHQLGSAGSGDPLNQRATMGWKIAYATKILRQVSLVRVLHTSTYEGGA